MAVAVAYMSELKKGLLEIITNSYSKLVELASSLYRDELSQRATQIFDFRNLISKLATPLEEMVLETPWSIFAYLFFAATTLAYIIHETFARYNGVKWVLSNPVPEQVKQTTIPLKLSNDKLKQVMALLRREIEKGLDPSTKKSSSVKCYSTYVQDLPTGKELGKFLALDLGGSNFRVLLVTLNGTFFHMKSKTYAIPNDIMTGSGDKRRRKEYVEIDLDAMVKVRRTLSPREIFALIPRPLLFDHIAECLHDLVKEEKIEKEILPLGFTFSFPVMQTSIKSSTLQRWTKGFNCSGVVGQDVLDLLQQAIDRRGDMRVNLAAILNDTTGTLMSCAWKNRDTKIGVILGTGTNACYVEKVENVKGLTNESGKELMLINTEWGAFGDQGELDFIRTKYDKDVDLKSINPSQQLFEKMISGMYLGEIVRLVVVDLIRNQLLFNGTLTPEISTEGGFATKHLSSIEGDKPGTFKKCRKVLKKYGYSSATDMECQILRWVCGCVSKRAADLASAGLATLINKMAYPQLTIGVDGSLYRFHPHFHCLMVNKISQLLDPNIKGFTLMLSSDGSGRGAAIVAAAASAPK